MENNLTIQFTFSEQSNSKVNLSQYTPKMILSMKKIIMITIINVTLVGQNHFQSSRSGPSLL